MPRVEISRSKTADTDTSIAGTPPRFDGEVLAERTVARGSVGFISSSGPIHAAIIVRFRGIGRCLPPEHATIGFLQRFIRSEVCISGAFLELCLGAQPLRSAKAV
jgi:hypothetical protein